MLYLVRVWLRYNYSVWVVGGVCVWFVRFGEWVVAFLFRTRMFIFTKRFPVTPTRNHNHSQLGYITPIDGRVKDVS